MQNDKPFAMNKNEKSRFFAQKIEELSEHHRRKCKTYGDICNGLGEDKPYLPVAVFKDLELRSTDEDKIVKNVTSSGTTGQRVSRIFLDGNTAAAQQRALCTIAGDLIGEDRIPMLIIDSPGVLRDRSRFSARGAGIRGFSMMASKRYYALNEKMEPDWEQIEQFREKAKEGPTFAFGFTYIIWSCFYTALKRSGRKLDFGDCCLIHGGGWKKMQDQKVSDSIFRHEMQTVCGMKNVADYYGMAEQTGSIFIQCPEGHLHASIFSEISILNPETFKECAIGEWGLIATESILPESYPGHRLLTEDWGRIIGEDDCPCGRKGRYFEIQGRISRSEIRGCSDTFEAVSDSAGNESENQAEGMSLLAGTYPPDRRKVPIFDDKTMDFLEKLSEILMRTPEYRQYPEVYSLGFWCRRSRIQALKERQTAGQQNSIKRTGRGTVFHIAPSNMPTMFAYSWITSLLAGNSNIVRISGKESQISRIILEAISSVLKRSEYAELYKSNAFVQFPRDHVQLETISASADARVIWGGDETVRRICAVPKAAGCIDITFPDKYSIAILDAGRINAMTDEEMKHQAHMFYNDTYGADQNACSSPRTVFWVTGKDRNENMLRKTKDRWWNALADEAAEYDLQPWMATEKYRMLCCTYAQHEGLMPVRRWGNRLYVIPCESLAGTGTGISGLEAKMGMFYECDITGIEELYPYLDEKIQTVVCDSRQDEIWKSVRAAGCRGVDRVVSIGEALDFDTVWDRKDLIQMLSE